MVILPIAGKLLLMVNYVIKDIRNNGEMNDISIYINELWRKLNECTIRSKQKHGK
jgi:hypothetical protein